MGCRSGQRKKAFVPWGTGRRKFSTQADLLTKKLCVLQERSGQESSHTQGDRQAR